MARYDSPGYPDQVPGFAPRNSHDYHTAPGSPGDRPEETYGAEVGRSDVSTPFASSQVDHNHLPVSVLAGDTSAMSSDQAVPANIAGVHVNGADTTGAGRGNIGHFPHRNSLGAGQ